MSLDVFLDIFVLEFCIGICKTDIIQKTAYLRLLEEGEDVSRVSDEKSKNLP
jgi:hypothetical protein